MRNDRTYFPPRRGGRARVKATRTRQLCLEELETRRLLNYTVNDGGDAPLDPSKGPAETSSGSITLRSAIQQIDMDGGGEIDFSVSMITCSDLPTIDVPAFVNGGAVGDVVISGSGLDFTGGGSVAEYLVINGSAGDGIDMSGDGNEVLDDYIGTDQTGSNAVGNGGSGVWLYDSYNTVTGCVVSGNANVGIGIDRGSGNLLEGDFIGTDFTGSKALPNGENGVDITDGASNNTVGGTTPSSRNIISGNAAPGPSGYAGVEIDGAGTTRNVVEGNLIGTDASGTKPIGNPFSGVGIFDGASYNTIGGTVTGARNIISANGDPGSSPGGNGIDIDNKGTTGNVVEGNFIGTDTTGTRALGNADGGVAIYNGASANTIGGTTAAARNVISGNGNGVGIANSDILGNTAPTTDNVVEGNFIGTDPTGTKGLANTVSGVFIFDGASDNTVGGTIAAAQNVISGNMGDGVDVADQGTSDNVVEGNLIGTSADGSESLGNQGNGISIIDATDNTIGGTTDGAANVIGSSGVQIGVAVAARATRPAAFGPEAASSTPSSSDGIFLSGMATGNVIEGDYIGVTRADDPAGNADDGVLISGASDNTIGGTTAAARDIISSNFGDGVDIVNGDSDTVAGDYIGTNIHGNVPQGETNPFADQDGVAITDGSNNTIGAALSMKPNQVNNGMLPSPASNLIRGNAQDGVNIEGTSPDNLISLDVIYGNGHMGIDLGGTITTLEGPNTWQTYPVLSSVTDSGGETTIQGFLEGAEPGQSYLIEFYANADVDSSGLSEGQWFLGTANASYDPELGYATISASFSTPSIPDATQTWNGEPVQDHFITAIAISTGTATNAAAAIAIKTADTPGGGGNTSEFSPVRDLLRGAVSFTYNLIPSGKKGMEINTFIKAFFIPETNKILAKRYNLEEAQEVCGVNHFNWLQCITPPAPWRFYVVTLGFFNRQLVSSPVPDPVENPDFAGNLGIQWLGYQLRAPGYKKFGSITVPWVTDSFPFYYNEVSIPGGSNGYLYSPAITESGVVNFYDRPYDPWFIEGNSSFRTFLVGIPFSPGTQANATAYIKWAGLNTGFYWQSNTKQVGKHYLKGGVHDVDYIRD